MNLPYRHDLLIRVTVSDDGPTGEHGYIDVAVRLAALIADLDPHVVDVASLPIGIVYLGKTEDVQEPDPPTGGTFTVTQGGNTTAPIPYDATMSEINQAADDAGVELTFGLDDPPAGFDGAGGVA